jgi:hypothetical protein
MKRSLMAGAASFAHLLGRGPVRAANESEEDGGNDPPRLNGESDEDWQRRKDAAVVEDEKREDETEEEHQIRVKENRDRRVKEAKDSEGSVDTDPGDSDGDEEGDEASDSEDFKKKAVRSARMRERARCAAIFADASAGKNPALAATLAFSTDLPRGQAVKVLRAGGMAVTTPRGTLDGRMAAVKLPPVGVGDPSAPVEAAGMTRAARDAAAVIEAGRKRRGEI